LEVSIKNFTKPEAGKNDKIFGWPYDYGEILTPKQARKNRQELKPILKR
jgi:hypothetical protein